MQRGAPHVPPRAGARHGGATGCHGLNNRRHQATRRTTASPVGPPRAQGLTVNLAALILDDRTSVECV